MEIKRLTRKQIREQIANTPIEQILHVPVRSLTTKQKEYCKKVAQGKPMSKAYREAYQSKAKPTTIGEEVQRMKKNPRILLEVEAQKRAIEFESAYSAKQLKSIVISQLTKEALNPESKPSERISALKALGSVAELGVFVERKEIRTIKDSSTAKAELLDKLRKAMKDQSRTIDADAMSLLDEINSHGAMQQENNLADEALAADPLPGDPPNSTDADSNLLHTNPLKQSQNKDESGKQSPIEDDSEESIENDSQETSEESEKS
jgi:hypothetical protein